MTKLFYPIQIFKNGSCSVRSFPNSAANEGQEIVAVIGEHISFSLSLPINCIHFFASLFGKLSEMIESR